MVLVGVGGSYEWSYGGGGFLMSGHRGEGGVNLKDITLEGYLADKKPPSPRTLQYASGKGPMVAVGGEDVSYERGTSVRVSGDKLVREAPRSGPLF